MNKHKTADDFGFFIFITCLLIFLLIFTVFSIAFNVGENITTEKWEAQAIEQGYGEIVVEEDKKVFKWIPIEGADNGTN